MLQRLKNFFIFYKKIGGDVVVPDDHGQCFMFAQATTILKLWQVLSNGRTMFAPTYRSGEVVVPQNRYARCWGHNFGGQCQFLTPHFFTPYIHYYSKVLSLSRNSIPLRYGNPYSPNLYTLSLHRYGLFSETDSA